MVTVSLSEPHPVVMVSFHEALLRWGGSAPTWPFGMGSQPLLPAELSGYKFAVCHLSPDWPLAVRSQAVPPRAAGRRVANAGLGS